MNVRIKLTAPVLLGLAAVGGDAPALYVQAAGRTVWDGVYTETQAARGKATYEARCASCHGLGLEGADLAPSLTGGRFMNAWKDQTVGAVVTRTRTTMPLGNPGSLGTAETVDIVAYILQQNQFPQGAAELPRDSASLQKIRIAPKGG
jgi:quinoprotein glucose dehydrogenase